MRTEADETADKYFRHLDDECLRRAANVPFLRNLNKSNIYSRYNLSSCSGITTSLNLAIAPQTLDEFPLLLHYLDEFLDNKQQALSPTGSPASPDRLPYRGMSLVCSSHSGERSCSGRTHYDPLQAVLLNAFKSEVVEAD